MGEPDQQKGRDAAQRAREEMHSVTESLRALLRDLRAEDERDPRAARSPGIAPSR